MKAFYVDETPTVGRYRIGLDMETYEYIRTQIVGSYNILAARVFGLPYPDYLRMVRDNYEATLNGKEGYMTYTFKNKLMAEKLIKELNKRWDIIIKNK